MKRKTLTLVLCLLTVLSLVGVGFASWVINADTSTKVDGNIVVDTVSDQRYTITAHVSSQNIIFAAPQDKTGVDNPWLTSDDAKGVATLTVKYTFTVTKNDGATFTLDDENNPTALTDLFIKVDFKEPDIETEGEGESEPTTTNYGKAKEDNLFELFNINGYKVSTVTLSDDKKTATFEVEMGYVWGTAFGSKNPFDYYNAKEANDEINGSNITYVEDALAKLTTLSKIDASCKYTATVTVNKTTMTGASAAQLPPKNPTESD